MEFATTETEVHQADLAAGDAIETGGLYNLVQPPALLTTRAKGPGIAYP